MMVATNWGQKLAQEYSLRFDYVYNSERGQPASPAPISALLNRTLLRRDEEIPVQIWSKPLRFYPGMELVDFRFRGAGGVASLRFICAMPEAVHSISIPVIALGGKQDGIHLLNSAIMRDTGKPLLDPSCDDGTLEDYLRFIAEHTATDDGVFFIAEDVADFSHDPEADEIASPEAEFRWVAQKRAESSGQAGGSEPSPFIAPDDVYEMLFPVTKVAADEDSASFSAVLIYADRLFHVGMHIGRAGDIQIETEIPRFDEMPLPVTAVRDTRNNREVLLSICGLPAGEIR